MVAHPETNRAACGHLACSVEVIRKVPTTGNDIAHSSGRGSLAGDSAVPETYAVPLYPRVVSLHSTAENRCSTSKFDHSRDITLRLPTTAATIHHALSPQASPLFANDEPCLHRSSFF